MTQEQFNQLSSVNIFTAVWYAKYMGVPVTVVKAWVAAIMASLTKQ